MEVLILANTNQCINDVKTALSAVYPESKARMYLDPLRAVQYAAGHPIDLILTEPDLKVLDGITLIQMLRKKYPDIKAVLIVDKRRNAGTRKAYPAELKITKPVTAEKLKALLSTTTGIGEENT